jgi:hypothetical protein
VAIDRQDSPYRRGIRFDRAPIPMDEEHCIPVDAGPVQFVVESRRLTNDVIDNTYHGDFYPKVAFDDGGATLHVCGAADGLEYLRFDCFENEPHYHYIDNAAGTNTVVRIDELAVGDPVEFSLNCVEHHLADMLRNCGVDTLADEVTGEHEKVSAALIDIRELMRRAAAPAT